MEHGEIQLAVSSGQQAEGVEHRARRKRKQVCLLHAEKPATRGRGDTANAFRFIYSFVAMRPFNFRHFSSI